MDQNLFKDFLLIQNESLKEFSQRYLDLSVGILPFVFMLGLLFEYFHEQDLPGLLKRTVVAICFLIIGKDLFEGAVEASLVAASTFLDESVFTNEILNKIQSLETKNGVVDLFRLAFIDEMGLGNSIFTGIVSLIGIVCLLIVKVCYSLGYYLSYIFFGVPLLLYILPNFQNSLKGALTSFFWVILLPHILAMTLSLTMGPVTEGFINQNFIGKDIANTGLHLAFCFIIALVPVITYFLLSGSGIVAGVSGFSSYLASSFISSSLSQMLQISRQGFQGGLSGISGLGRNIMSSSQSSSPLSSHENFGQGGIGQNSFSPPLYGGKPGNFLASKTNSLSNPGNHGNENSFRSSNSMSSNNGSSRTWGGFSSEKMQAANNLRSESSGLRYTESLHSKETLGRGTQMSGMTPPRGENSNLPGVSPKGHSSQNLIYPNLEKQLSTFRAPRLGQTQNPKMYRNPNGKV